MPSTSTIFGKISSRTAWSGRWKHYSPSKHHIYLPVMLQYITQETWIPRYEKFAICWWGLNVYKKTPLISRKGIIRLCTMRLTFSLGPDFTMRLWYLFTNHIALISGYRCFTSQYEVQSVNRMATTWHYYCCHNLLPLVAHTVKCSESFPAWFNTLITVLYCAVQVFFCI